MAGTTQLELSPDSVLAQGDPRQATALPEREQARIQDANLLLILDLSSRKPGWYLNCPDQSLPILALLAVASAKSNFGEVSVNGQRVQTNNWLLLPSASATACAGVIDDASGRCIQSFPTIAAGVAAMIDAISLPQNAALQRSFIDGNLNELSAALVESGYLSASAVQLGAILQNVANAVPMQNNWTSSGGGASGGGGGSGGGSAGGGGVIDGGDGGWSSGGGDDGNWDAGGTGGTGGTGAAAETAPSGMSTTTKVLIGAAVLGGLGWLAFSRGMIGGGGSSMPNLPSAPNRDEEREPNPIGRAGGLALPYPLPYDVRDAIIRATEDACKAHLASLTDPVAKMRISHNLTTLPTSSYKAIARAVVKLGFAESDLQNRNDVDDLIVATWSECVNNASATFPAWAPAVLTRSQYERLNPGLPSSYSGGQEREPNPAGSRIQSLMFTKGHFSKKEAQAWAKKHNFKSDVDEQPNVWRMRQEDPSHFKRYFVRELKPGIQGVMGVPKAKYAKNPVGEGSISDADLERILSGKGQDIPFPQSYGDQLVLIERLQREFLKEVRSPGMDYTKIKRTLHGLVWAHQASLAMNPPMEEMAIFLLNSTVLATHNSDAQGRTVAAITTASAAPELRPALEALLKAFRKQQEREVMNFKYTKNPVILDSNLAGPDREFFINESADNIERAARENLSPAARHQRILHVFGKARNGQYFYSLLGELDKRANRLKDRHVFNTISREASIQILDDIFCILHSRTMLPSEKQQDFAHLDRFVTLVGARRELDAALDHYGMKATYYGWVR